MADIVAFEVKWNEKVLRAIEQAPTEVLNRLAEETVAEAKRLSPYSKQGKAGFNRISIDFDTPKVGVRKIFTTSGYGALLEIGTGIFGPRKQRIVPKRAKVLSWKDASGKRIYAKSVKGRPATPYMRPALEAVKRRVDTILDGLVKE